jgi:uncharacterized membrane protein YgaE (UPF0421/DUF939 family)
MDEVKKKYYKELYKEILKLKPKANVRQEIKDIEKQKYIRKCEIIVNNYYKNKRNIKKQIKEIESALKARFRLKEFSKTDYYIMQYNYFDEMRLVHQREDLLNDLRKLEYNKNYCQEYLNTLKENDWN